MKFVFFDFHYIFQTFRCLGVQQWTVNLVTVGELAEEGSFPGDHTWFLLGMFEIHKNCGRCKILFMSISLAAQWNLVWYKVDQYLPRASGTFQIAQSENEKINTDPPTTHLKTQRIFTCITLRVQAHRNLLDWFEAWIFEFQSRFWLYPNIFRH